MRDADCDLGTSQREDRSRVASADAWKAALDTWTARLWRRDRRATSRSVGHRRLGSKSARARVATPLAALLALGAAAASLAACAPSDASVGDRVPPPAASIASATSATA